MGTIISLFIILICLHAKTKFAIVVSVNSSNPTYNYLKTNGIGLTVLFETSHEYRNDQIKIGLICGRPSRSTDQF